jgi:glycine dehydrogenase subunit 1
MLQAIGIRSVDELFAPIPAEYRLKSDLTIPRQMAESEIVDWFKQRAKENGEGYTSFLGAGAYFHYRPVVIDALVQRGEFLTSYTPYQAEVSQGYLQAIYEWQTYIALLTGMDVANASVYDGATALAEAAIMAINATGRKAVLVSRAVHPNYRAVLRTYAHGLDITVDELPYAANGATDFHALHTLLADQRYAAVIVQSPNFFGTIDPPPAAAVAAIKATQTLLIGVTAEALSLAALATPASWGVDIAVGEGQSFGNAIAYGGPHVGFIATTNEQLRRIPGRLVGRTVDKDGRTAYVLTLQAREQHIRREKATSNICTNQAHCALVATIYLAAFGKTGLRDVAAHNVARTAQLRAAVAAIDGCEVAFDAPVFNEFVLRVPGPASGVLDALREHHIVGGLDLGRFYPELADCILMNATELTTPVEIGRLVTALREVAEHALTRI